MASQKDIFEYIVIGTGPGGAPVARELAKAGKKVVMVEKGAYHKHLGFPVGGLVFDRMLLGARTVEGVMVERAITVGGTSIIYNGNVFEPPNFLLEKMGIDFSPECKEIKKEIGVNVLPERFFSHTKSKGGQRMRDAAEKMGIPFTAQEKFIDPNKCKPGCDWCMMGCSRNAKWTTRVYVDDALKAGATLIHSAPVDKVLFNHNRSQAIGVRLGNGQEIMGDHVIVAAGGVGSPALLQRSGFKDPGSQFFMDPMNVLYATSKDSDGGTWQETTFTHAIESFEHTDGFIIGNNGSLINWVLMNCGNAKSISENWHKLFTIKRGMGLFIKLAESSNGKVFANDKTSKTFTADDNRRLDKGTQIATEILIKAGAKPSSISELRWVGGHPGGTVAMGEFVDQSFRFEVPNLYVCDASVFPCSPGAPPTLALLGMSKLLGKMLLGQVKTE
ncbi:MAG: GMC family oxidoreductase N-terminal domain-containing protein, partial [Ignavibacteriales bacterium]